MIHIRPDIPIILLTGFSDRVDEEKARDIGIKRFVMKPLSFSEIANIVRDVLDGEE